MHNPLAVLFDELHFSSAGSALVVAKGVSRQGRPGSATLVYLDQGRRLVDLLMVAEGGDSLVQLVEATCSADDTDVASLLLVTDRTGEVPADRPDDELLWCELVDLAAAADTVLLDWFVVCGNQAFSVAEFAPQRAQW